MFGQSRTLRLATAARDLRPGALLGRLLRIGVVLVVGGFVLSLLTDDPALQVVAPLFSVLVLVQLFPMVRAGELDLFEPPVLTGIQGAFATVASVAAFSSEGTLSLAWLEFLSPDETQWLAMKVILGSILGLLFYYAGYYAPWGQRLARVSRNKAGPPWSRTRLHLVCFGLFAAFALSYAIFQSRVGVALTDVTQLAAGKAVWRDDPTSSWMTRGVQLGFLASLLYIAAADVRKGPQRLVVPGVLLLINAVLVSRLGQRGAYMAPLLTGLAIVHYRWRRVPTWLFAAGLLVVLVVSNVQLLWRTSTEPVDSRATVEGSLRNPAEALAVHEGERQRFSALALVFFEFPERRDHLMGETYAGLIASFVPRWIWPEKTEYFVWRDTGIIRNLVGAPVPTSYLGVLWVNWSWVGIAIGMLLFGMFHRFIYEAFRRSGSDPGTTLMYCTTVVFFVPTLLSIALVIQYVVLGPLAIWVIRERRAGAERARARGIPAGAGP